MDVDKKTIATYDKGVSFLIKKYNLIGARKEDIKKTMAFVKVKNPRVLEFGCGHGREAQEILKYTRDYFGIDASRKFIEVAKKFLPEGNFILADFEKCQFPEKIDVIFAFASLLHSNKENLAIIYKKVAGSLNKGGIFFISLKYGKYHQEIVTEQIGTRTFYFYTPLEIERLIPECLKNVFEEIQYLNGQKWFTVILQKF